MWILTKAPRVAAGAGEMVTISGKVALAGVLGWPVSHSKSPLLHNYWFERYRLGGVYVPLAIAPTDLEATIRALFRMGFRGFSVTLSGFVTDICQVPSQPKVEEKRGRCAHAE